MNLPDWLTILPDVDALNHAAAREFVNCAQAAIRDRGRFAVALSGGNTPRAVYSLLATEFATSLPWGKVFIFFGDERHVPPEHADSNYRMANESLLSRVPIPAQNIYRVEAERDARTAAELYDAALHKYFALKNNEAPRFDLILLGMGDDGHTASLFPGTAALQETSHLVVANWVEKFNSDRITFTLPVLNAAAEDLVIIAGESKADVISHILDSPAIVRYPIQKVHPGNGRLRWLVEQKAARLIQK